MVTAPADPAAGRLAAGMLAGGAPPGPALWASTAPLPAIALIASANATVAPSRDLVGVTERIMRPPPTPHAAHEGSRQPRHCPLRPPPASSRVVSVYA